MMNGVGLMNSMKLKKGPWFSKHEVMRKLGGAGVTSYKCKTKCHILRIWIYVFPGEGASRFPLSENGLKCKNGRCMQRNVTN